MTHAPRRRAPMGSDLVVATLACLAMVVGPALAEARHRSAAPRQGGVYLVDTTADSLESETDCAGDQPCPLRSAVWLADHAGGGTVTARMCDDATTTHCLSTSDPNYDAATGQWTFPLDATLGAVIMERGGVVVDFVAFVSGWSGPGDNRVVIRGTGDAAQGFVVQGDSHTLRGMDFRGTFTNAAIEVSSSAHDVTLGPGIVVAGMAAQAGIRLRDPDVQTNKLIGSWCGITGPDQTSLPMRGDCVLLDRGANHNVVGGAGADANILAAATGRGIVVTGPGGDANELTDNVIGATRDAPGSLAGVGIQITDGGANVVARNVILGLGSTAIRIGGTSFGNVVRENELGFERASGRGFGNSGWGLDLRERAKGTEVVSNVIRGNAAGGILVSGGQADNNHISQNEVADNAGDGIRVSGGANGGVQPPVWSIVREAQASGSTCGGCTVEIFSDWGDQAEFYEGSAVAAASTFFFDQPGGFRGPFLTATTTRSGNTSGLSAAKQVPGVPTATPRPSPTRVPGEGYTVHLPWAGKHAE